MEGLIESRSQMLYYTFVTIPTEKPKIPDPTEYIETSSKLFRNIHSMFDAEKEDMVGSATSPYNTRSYHQQPKRLNLGDSWSDSTPAFVESSGPAGPSNDNIGETAIPGRYTLGNEP